MKCTKFSFKVEFIYGPESISYLSGSGKFIATIDRIVTCEFEAGSVAPDRYPIANWY